MSKGGRIAVGVVFFLLFVIVGWVYLSGFIYLLMAKFDPTKVTYHTFFDYWQHYGHIAKVKANLLKAGGGAAFVVVAVPIVIVLANLKPKRELHGSARFATPQEVREAGLGAEKGIIVGKYQNRYLVFGGQQFVLMAAPTRAGKGVSMVIPNLLNYDGSVVVLDVKQENYDITAGYRRKYGQEVYLFNPFAEDGRTHRYNPLAYISPDRAFRIGDIQAIAATFYPADGKDPFWDEQARNLFLGLTLLVLETPGLPVTVGELLRQSSGKGQPLKDYLLDAIETRAKGDDPLSADCVDALNRFCSNSDNTLSSILSSFNSPLGIWANPIVDAATSTNDFDLRDVRKRRMSIYIGVTPNNLPQTARLINVFFSQLVNLNTKELPAKNPELKYPCLLLMDEFTAIGKVAIIAKAVSYMAGYNLRLLPIIQSKQQLVSVYGQEDAGTFITNHALHVIFAPREQKDAQDYSDMLGYETVKSKGKSRNIGNGRGGGSESTSDQRRALLMPQELRELGQWKQIISLENVKPILCDKIKYFDDPSFLDRLKEIAPSLKALGKAKPNKDQLEAAAFGGELAPPVPIIDVALYMAQAQQMVRDVTVADADAGIDISKLAHDFSDVPTLEGTDVSQADVEKMCMAFFGSAGIDIELPAASEASADAGIEGVIEQADGDDVPAWVNDHAESDFVPDFEGIEDVPGEGMESHEWVPDESDSEPATPAELVSNGVDLSVLD